MIAASSLPEQLQGLVIQKILEGQLKAGQRIALNAIAQELGISPTPVREGLNQLTHSGLVEYITNRGFFVTDPSPKELSELYEFIILLEQEMMGKASSTALSLDRLQQCNERFRKARSVAERLKWDAEFHRALIKGHDNDTMRQTTEKVRLRILVHEHRFMDMSDVSPSYATHQSIISHLGQGKLKEARRELKKNWEMSMDILIPST